MDVNAEALLLRRRLQASAAVIARTGDLCAPSTLDAVDIAGAAFAGGSKLLLCGNGGSAADCQHMAAEFTNRLSRGVNRPGLPAIALTTDTSFLTGYANDFDFQGIFARQVEALGKQDDVLLAISTSGDSENILLAVEEARVQGLQTIGLTGEKGRLREIVDVAICIPSTNTQHIQEAHLVVEHVICNLVERQLFPELFADTAEPDTQHSDESLRTV